MRFHERALHERRHPHHVDGGGGRPGPHPVLCRCHHDEHLSQVENRARNRGPAVEDRSGRHQGLLQHGNRILAEQGRVFFLIVPVGGMNMVGGMQTVNGSFFFCAMTLSVR